MLKATKKALANNIKTITDADIKVDYEKDMTGKEIKRESPEDVLLKAQKAKYFSYLEKEIKTSSFQFLHDMHAKLLKGETLTPNMEKAIEKCMAYNHTSQGTEAKEPVDESKLPKITCKMRQWWMKENKLDSRVISGVILIETKKAYKIKGHADIVEGTFCMRCGRELTEPASMLVGFGAECCEKLGIPYPADIKTASKAQREAIKKSLLKVLHNQTFELWVPKSQIEEVYPEKHNHVHGEKPKNKR